MNRDLFLAILSMDSYNRNYGQGLITVSGDSTDGQQNESGRVLGNAKILFDSSILEDENENRLDIPAGFYAIAYDMTGVAGFADGERVISYRGTNANWDADGVTDFLGRPLVKDAINGWSVGAGYPGGQANFAIDFYKAVAGDGNNPFTANITTTGHSLGGGLAGLAANDNAQQMEAAA